MTKHFMETVTGRHINLKAPQPADIDIRDIAHGLSMRCRFAGQCREFYSVAQHSVMVARRVWVTHPEHAFKALLHDAHEAYLLDVPTPLKSLLGSNYETLVRFFDLAIFEAFGLPDDDLPAVIKDADQVELDIEAQTLMATGGHGWGCWSEPRSTDALQRPQSPTEARAEFLRMFSFYKSQHTPVAWPKPIVCCSTVQS